MNFWKSYLRIMRPSQWIKNGFVGMPLVFSGRLVDFGDSVRTFGIFLMFCLIASTTYIINDYMDMDQDKAHPVKKKRPLASGDMSPTEAFVLAGALVIGSALLGGAIRVPAFCYALLAIYLLLHVTYSIWLKQLVIVDVMAIAAGFLLRVISGAAVISVPVSSWLILCTFTVAVFLALGKRRNEVIVLCDNASCHRPVLKDYNMGLLDQLLQVVTTSTFIFYCLYVVYGTDKQTERMMVTIPLVAYGIFRYLYLIYHRQDGGSPTDLLLNDRPLLASLAVWLAACVVIIYT